jgi:hypothetical protein
VPLLWPPVFLPVESALGDEYFPHVCGVTFPEHLVGVARESTTQPSRTSGTVPQPSGKIFKCLRRLLSIVEYGMAWLNIRRVRSYFFF